MPKRHRNYRTGIKRQVAEYHAGDTLHALGHRHELSRNPIRIRIGKAEAGVSNEDAAAARLLADREARIAAVLRRVGRQALGIGFPKRRHAPDPCRKRACIHDNRPVGLSTNTKPSTIWLRGCPASSRHTTPVARIQPRPVRGPQHLRTSQNRRVIPSTPRGAVHHALRHSHLLAPHPLRAGNAADGRRCMRQAGLRGV